MVEETADVNEWHTPMEQWSNWECTYFTKWFAEYHKEAQLGTMEETLTAYRAVRDVEASVETYTYKAKERYAYGWTDSRGIFGSNGS